MNQKVVTNRLRRMAQRQALRLESSRRRDPRALDYGLYRLVNDDGMIVMPLTSLETLETFLVTPRHARPVGSSTISA